MKSSVKKLFSNWNWEPLMVMSLELITVSCVLIPQECNIKWFWACGWARSMCSWMPQYLKHLMMADSRTLSTEWLLCPALIALMTCTFVERGRTCLPLLRGFDMTLELITLQTCFTDVLLGAYENIYQQYVACNHADLMGEAVVVKIF